MTPPQILHAGRAEDLERAPDPDDLAELEWLREKLGEGNWWTRGDSNP